MGNKEKLENPPIIEAILQIAFVIPSFATADDFKPFIETVASEYSEVRELISLQFVQQLDRQVSDTPLDMSMGTKINGYMLLKEPQEQFIHLTNNAIGLIRKKPYTSWDEISQEFKELWGKLKSIFPDIVPNKLSVRYVNKMDVTLNPDKGIQEFFLLIPNLPEKISPSYEKYLLQMQIPNKENNLVSNVTQVYNPCQKTEGKVHYSLDIEINSEISEKEDIWEMFEKMRIFKNSIFFNSITESTKKLYNAISSNS